MPTEDRLDRIEANPEKLSHANADAQAASAATQVNLDRPTRVTATIAESAAARHQRIGKLVAMAEIQQQSWEQLQREWQAYLTTIRSRQ